MWFCPVLLLYQKLGVFLLLCGVRGERSSIITEFWSSYGSTQTGWLFQIKKRLCHSAHTQPLNIIFCPRFGLPAIQCPELPFIWFQSKYLTISSVWLVVLVPKEYYCPLQALFSLPCPNCLGLLKCYIIILKNILQFWSHHTRWTRCNSHSDH